MDKKNITKAEVIDRYPMAAIDAVDHEHVTAEEVKSATHSLNDNPRDNKIDE